MFLRTRSQDYLEKGLGEDFYKLPRATAMKTLSAVRAILYGFSSCFLNDSVKPAQTESGSLLPCLIHSFTHRGVPVVAKNDPHRMRFTRALLENKDFFMWFCLPLYV